MQCSPGVSVGFPSSGRSTAFLEDGESFESELLSKFDSSADSSGTIARRNVRREQGGEKIKSARWNCQRDEGASRRGEGGG